MVVNEERMVLGPLREKDLASEPAATAEETMRPGPTTVRPDTPAGKMVERVRKRGTASVPVTTPDGALVRLMYREDDEHLANEQA